MIRQINYYSPEKIDELNRLLSEFGERAKIIAGGTDIIPALRNKSARFVRVDTLLDVKKIAPLHEIKIYNDKITIGSAVTFSEIYKNEHLQEHFPLLVQAASRIGSVQIRNRATIGGNLVNNAPCADSAPPLLVYNANLIISSSQGERKVPLNKFFTSPYRTQLAANEVVTHIEIPHLSENYRGEFYKLGRRKAVAVSRISLAILLKLVGEKVENIRIASGAVTPVAKRFFDLEKKATGKTFSREFCIELAQEMGKQVLEITGLRYSSAYKLPVVQQMFYQLLQRIGKN